MSLHINRHLARRRIGPAAAAAAISSVGGVVGAYWVGWTVGRMHEQSSRFNLESRAGTKGSLLI